MKKRFISAKLSALWNMQIKLQNLILIHTALSRTGKVNFLELFDRQFRISSFPFVEIKEGRQDVFF